MRASWESESSDDLCLDSNRKRQPVRASGRIWYVLSLNPVPWTVGELGFSGSKGGKKHVYMAPNKDLKLYKEAIQEEMERFDTFPLATELDVVFVFNRALDAVFRGNARSRAHQADATNMQKATEDALQGILFTNDSQNRVVMSIIREQNFEASPCVAIGIKVTNGNRVRSLIDPAVEAEIVKVSR